MDPQKRTKFWLEKFYFAFRILL